MLPHRNDNIAPANVAHRAIGRHFYRPWLPVHASAPQNAVCAMVLAAMAASAASVNDVTLSSSIVKERACKLVLSRRQKYRPRPLLMRISANIRPIRARARSKPNLACRKAPCAPGAGGTIFGIGLLLHRPAGVRVPVSACCCVVLPAYVASSCVVSGLEKYARAAVSDAAAALPEIRGPSKLA